jgi:DNA-binding response OmpR family regulator
MMARKILLADDSVAVQKAVEATLKEKDFEILPAATGSQAIEQAKTAHPDVILLDSDLPEGDGYETCRRMKKDAELAHIPVIVLTSEGGESLAREAGAEGHLVKPFQGNALLARVSELLDWAGNEEPDKTDTAEMDVQGLGLEDDVLPDEFELEDLELEGEDILELTEELEPVTLDTSQESAGADIDEFGLGEEGITWTGTGTDAEEPEEVKTEEMEDFSLEAELEDFDLGELELEGTEEVPPLGEELADEKLGAGPGPADTEVLESAAGVEEEFDLGDLDLTSELDLFDSSDEEALAAPEAEERGLQDEEAGLLHETGIGVSEPEEPDLMQTNEEEVLEERRFEEDISSEEEDILSLDETAIQFEDVREAVEGAAPQEEPSDTNIQELQGISSSEEVFESEAAAMEPSVDRGIELNEEVALENELSPEAEEETAPPQTWPEEFEELPIEAIPTLQQGLRLELSAEDFGVIDPFSEEGIRKQLSKNIQEMVERILSDMAPSIIERVAREIALERTEKIVMEEIERLRPQPEGL